MCGITGFIDFTHTSSLSVLTEMTDALIHRGPDDSGYELVTTAHAVVGLGHRRLSILDLSVEGKQPMTSATGRYILCFNGEIYNFQDIRAELQSIGEAPAWRGHSDTEVLLAAIEHFGLQRALQKSIGMFALALWDKKEQVLSLARDRMGEKPLYYGWQGKTFLFGSELKALTKHPAWIGEIDRGALTLYVRHSYIPGPYSIYQGIAKLPPGTILRVDVNNDARHTQKPESYWSLYDVVCRGIEQPFAGDEKEAVDELERLLLAAVARQMTADVPLGAFLSGGYDSSLITALMQAQSARPVRTFSIGFHESGYNEAPYAKAVAEHLGTEHTELYATPQDAIDLIDQLSSVVYDEPFADSSQIPTLLLSKMTKKHVTVALTGDGGDELMRGYQERYNKTLRLWNFFDSIPSGARKVAGNIMGHAPLSFKTVGHRVRQIGSAALFFDFPHYYRYMVSVCKTPEKILLMPFETRTFYDDIDLNHGLNPDYNKLMLYIDSMTYLPDDLLVKTDRAAMSVSLETRIPLLDHLVVEFIWSLPDKFRWCDGISKWALRQMAYKYIPRHLLERPKKGFSVPVADWIQGPLHSWAERILDVNILQQQGIFQAAQIQALWKEHTVQKRNRINFLWPVLMANKITMHKNAAIRTK